MNLKQAAETVLTECLKVKENEKVAIVADEVTRDIAYEIHKQALKIAEESVYVEIRERENNGMEPPEMAASLMEKCDVCILATNKSLSHTVARKKANMKGARIASMPGITEDMALRTLKGGYQGIALDCRKYADILSGGKKARVVTESGTDLVFSIEGRKGASDDGILDTKGIFGNLPAGEAYVAPLEGTANGILVIDASMAGIGLLAEPIRIEVEKGMARRVSGGEEAEKLQGILEKYGENTRNIAELGIGLNPEAEITGKILEDEKKKGTIHIALGDNSTIGGVVQADSHLDGVILEPTVYIDDEKIMDKGKLLK